MISNVWRGDEPINQPFGRTTVVEEPWYSPLKCRWHCGIDIGSPDCKGRPLFAARAGKVSWLSLGILGITVPDGETDWYVHGEYEVLWGQRIAQSERIGVFSNIVPRGGASTGPHLHFEVQPKGGWINVPPALDPEPVLSALHGGGISQGDNMTVDEHKVLYDTLVLVRNLYFALGLPIANPADPTTAKSPLLEDLKAEVANLTLPATITPQFAADLATVAGALRKLGVA